MNTNTDTNTNPSTATSAATAKSKVGRKKGVMTLGVITFEELSKLVSDPNAQVTIGVKYLAKLKSSASVPSTTGV